LEALLSTQRQPLGCCSQPSSIAPPALGGRVDPNNTPPLLRRWMKYWPTIWNESGQDYEESLAAVRRGYEDVKARPAAESLEDLREKHGFPR